MKEQILIRPFNTDLSHHDWEIIYELFRWNSRKDSRLVEDAGEVREGTDCFPAYKINFNVKEVSIGLNIGGVSGTYCLEIFWNGLQPEPVKRGSH